MAWRIWSLGLLTVSERKSITGPLCHRHRQPPISSRINSVIAEAPVVLFSAHRNRSQSRLERGPPGDRLYQSTSWVLIYHI
jgi:hypothetical protein